MDRNNRGFAALIFQWTLALFLLGAVAYGLLIANHHATKVADAVVGEVRLSVMLTDSVGQSQRDALRRTIDLMSEVRRTDYISSAQAASEFAAQTGHQIMSGITLPSSIEVFCTGGVASLNRIKVKLSRQSGVRSLVYDPKIVEWRDTLGDRLQVAAQIFVALLVLVVLALLYGATKAWSLTQRRHAVVRKALNAGVVAGVASGALILAADQVMERMLPEFSLTIELAALIAATMIVASALVSLLYGWILMQKQQ